MKRTFEPVLAALMIALLAAALSAGVAGAQGGEDQDYCATDVVNYNVCFVRGGDMDIFYIEGGYGHGIGTIPANFFRYAAATYEAAPQFVTRVRNDETGWSAELYFSGKSPTPGTKVATYWTIVIYHASGARIAAADVMGEYEPDATATFTLPGDTSGARVPVAAAAAAGPATTTTTVPAVPYDGTFELNVVSPGTVEECLVRTTYTVRLREAPTTAAPILDSVPYNTSMPADYRTADGQWVRAYYVGEGGVGQLGWLYSRYLFQSEACENLTTVSPVGEGMVTVTVTTGQAPAPAPAAAPAAAEPTTLEGPAVDLTVVQPGTVEECLVRTTYTVRARTAPTTRAPVIENVPYNTSMPADFRTIDGEWIRAYYVAQGGVGVHGWIHTRYLFQSEACANLNGIAPME